MAKPFDQIITVDFETRWSKSDYTLSKMTTEEYIRDERFRAFGLCVHVFGSSEPIRWIRGDDIPEFVSGIDWGRTAVLAHNAQFDVSILSWVYNARPKFIFDTLSMARALRGVEVGNSLAQLATSFDLPPKGTAVYTTDGLSELDPEIEKELAEYCKHDVFLCEEVFVRLVRGYPKSELRLIDMTLKMYTDPVLELDSQMLEEALIDERNNREALLERLGVSDSLLASNPQFAEVLRSLGVEPPTKVSKTTGKRTLALAKNDALFQALLNGPNEDVAALCEARLKVKSTTERTRAQRFLDISNRGTLPVPLSYYGALSGRWTASKGSAINMQNLKRGSFLRKAIMAPDGYELVVGDLSQIEPRVLAWFADYEDMLLIFKSGGDPYAAFGAQMFNIPGMTKDTHPDLRQSAKSALLGCFGPDTPVLTNRGWLPIVQVQATDTVWDGEEWVCHQGVVPQGEKEVLTALGISATSDHEILTEHGWAQWSEVLANHSRLKSALSLASLPVSAGSADSTSKAEGAFTHACAVLVDGKALCTEVMYSAELQPGAIVALKENPSKHAGSKRATSRYALTGSTAIACSTGSAPSLCDAPTPTAQFTQIMAGVASRCTDLGSKIVSSFSSTWSALTGGTSPSYSSTASTTTEAIRRAIYASSHEAKICRTNARSKHVTSSNSSNASPRLKQKMQTYDIAYAGPRNCYTVLTNEGPLIVHNCGYGLGWASFASQLLTGFLGAPPQRYNMEFAKKLGVTRTYVENFLNKGDNIARMLEIPHTCTEHELLTHSVAAKKIIDIYRATAWPVVGFWEMCSTLIGKSLADGEEVVYKCITFRKEEIVLPNGMSLLYPNLRQKKDDKGKWNWVYGKDETKLYAGKVTNNIVQGTARIVMTDGMLRVSERYPIKGTVHDELIAVVPEAEAEEGLKWVIEQMTMEPKYMPGIPLGADGGHHKRYGLAKN